MLYLSMINVFVCVCVFMLAHVCEKGLEAVARRQGKHKQKIWLKISSSGLKIVEERTGVSQLNGPFFLFDFFSPFIYLYKYI